MTRRSGLLCLSAAVLAVSTGLSGQDRAGSARPPSTAGGDWPHYTADMRGTKYSPLDQINAGNFNTLEVAWRFKTDMLGPRPEYKLEGTPLAINGVLYTTGGTRRSVVASMAGPESCSGRTACAKASAPRSHRGSCPAGACRSGP